MWILIAVSSNFFLSKIWPHFLNLTNRLTHLHIGYSYVLILHTHTFMANIAHFALWNALFFRKFFQKTKKRIAPHPSQWSSAEWSYQLRIRSIRQQCEKRLIEKFLLHFIFHQMWFKISIFLFFRTHCTYSIGPY